MSYTATDMKRFRDGWQRYDRLTALGCAQQGTEYDRAAALRAWESYSDLFREREMEPPPAP